MDQPSRQATRNRYYEHLNMLKASKGHADFVDYFKRKGCFHGDVAANGSEQGFSGTMYYHKDYHKKYFRKYDGIWTKESRFKFGQLDFSSGAVYIGNFRKKIDVSNGDKNDDKDVMHGEGKFIWPDGGFYVGQWHNDCEHGRGEEWRPSRDGMVIYTGNFEFGLKSGKGICKYADGSSTYDGYRINGERDGTGTCKYADGTSYEGDWSNGKREGQGTLWSADGVTYYVGEWKEDLKHGQGICVYANCTTYEGDWSKGEREGHGTLYAEDGTTELYGGDWIGDNVDRRGLQKVDDSMEESSNVSSMMVSEGPSAVATENNSQGPANHVASHQEDVSMISSQFSILSIGGMSAVRAEFRGQGPHNDVQKYLLTF